MQTCTLFSKSRTPLETPRNIPLGIPLEPPTAAPHGEALAAALMDESPPSAFSIPTFQAHFADLTSLTSIIITNALLSGKILPFLCDLPEMYVIDLHANNLTGSIPGCFTAKFTSIDLGENRLSGSIPASLFHGKTIFSGLIQLNLYENQLTGQIPQSFRNIKFDTVNLSGNWLTGDASFLFGTLKTATHIDLSRNELEFDLSLVMFPYTLRLVDISHNRIYGRIPNQITKLKSLYALNVSYNKLCGPIPGGGMMSSIDRASFHHNQCLCGAPLSPCNATIGD